MYIKKRICSFQSRDVSRRKTAEKPVGVSRHVFLDEEILMRFRTMSFEKIRAFFFFSFFS